MRTTLNLDGEALRAAVELLPGWTKTQILNQALREYVRRQRVQEVLELRGKVRWEGNLDELRGRVAR